MILEDYEALKCRYPSKKCWNQRAVKRNGERHNLCEMHRQKANNNQRRLDKKRKAGHMLKGEPSSGENDAPEYDYHSQAALAQQQQHHHQQHMHHHHHPYSRPALHQHQHLHQQQQQLLLQQHLPQQLSLLQRQQAMAQHYHQQQEKRLRVSLTNMYAAAQALSPHGHSPQLHSPPTHARELAPLRPSSASSLPTAPRPVLHLPPLTAHIPSIGKSSSRSSSPQTAPSSSSASPPAPLSRSSSVNLSTAKSTTTTSPQLASKPTILLPPITSVPRCHQSPFQLPLAGGAASSASWSLRSEEKAHLA